MQRRDFLAGSVGLAASLLAHAVPAAKVSDEASASVPFTELLPPEGTARKLRCRWSDRHRLASTLLGRTPGKGDYIVCSKPPEHPRCPGLFVREIEITGDGPARWHAWPVPSGAKVCSFDHALIVVHYGAPDF